MKKNQKYLLISLLVIVALLVIVLQLKMVSSTNQPSFSSFYGLRQVENIHETGFPIIFDSLSYQGRVNVAQIGFYYLVSLFVFLIPIILFFKYASIFLWIIIVFLMYFIANKLFANKMLVWLLTLFTILSPILFTAHLNSFEPSMLFGILFLLILKLCFSIKKETSLAFIILILISTFISSLSLIFIVAFLIYVILIKMSSKKLNRSEIELILFSGVFITWLHFILYRKLFLEHGVSLFQASIPSELMLGSFYGLSITIALSIAGLIPLLLGTYGTYFVLFKEPNKKHLLIVSFLFAFILALWAGFISFTQGFFYITLLLILLTGITIQQFAGYLNKTILQNLKPLFFVAIVILTIVNFLPVIGYTQTIVDSAPTPDEIQTMKFLSENTSVDATVLSTIQEGHLISSEAERKNFFDTNFIFAPQANQRYIDAETMFLSKSQSAIVGHMDYYSIDYVYISQQTRKTYSSTSSTFESSECFDLVFETKTTKVFEQTCGK